MTREAVEPELVESAEAADPAEAPTAEETPPAAPRLPSRWPLRLSFLYLAFVVLVWLLSRGFAERRWWSTLLLYFPQIVYLAPLLVTLPPALWQRNRRALQANAVAALLVLGPMMGWNVPLPQWPVSRAEPRVRVLAYNVYGGWKSADPIGPEIERFRPDVVVLCEMRGWFQQTAMRESMQRHFAGWHTTEAGDVFLASRWPFAERGSVPLGPRERDPSLHRELTYARVDAPGGSFWLAGAHFRTSVHDRSLRREWRRLPSYLRHATGIRRDQVEAIRTWMQGRAEPVILAGDFNTPPDGHLYARLRGLFGDAWDSRGWGWGYTYPAHRPVLRIDYVFHTRHWRALECRTGGKQGSDHLPVFAELVHAR